MKIRAFILPLASLVGLGFAGMTARELMIQQPETPVTAVPAKSPFARALAGAGIIEPSTEFVNVAAQVSGTAVEVLAAPGLRVAKGDVLFRLDDRTLKAERAARAASIEQFRSQLDRLLAAPRKEELPPLEAGVKELEEWLADDKDKLERAEKLARDGAGFERDVTAARFAMQARQARLEKARSDLDLVRAGTWAPEIVVARTNVSQAEALLAQTDTALDLLVVRAPIDGTILQVNVRSGEYVQSAAATAPIIMGSIDPLHIRIDLDENDASRFQPGAKAEAFLRGFSDQEHALDIEFVRVEPFVIPKRALTGSAIERVDTRVLQVIYRVMRKPARFQVYCGQQVDVWIDAGTTN